MDFSDGWGGGGVGEGLEVYGVGVVHFGDFGLGLWVGDVRLIGVNKFWGLIWG